MKTLFICLILIIFSVFIYGLTLRGTRGNPTPASIKESMNEGTKPFGIAPDRGRFILTQNLVERRSFALGKEQADAASPDVGYYKGNFFIFFAPGMSIFALPFYIIGQHYNLSMIATFTMGILFAVANLVLIFLISKNILRMPYWASILASLIFAFCSTSFSYAPTLYQHHPTAYFILSSFYAIYQYKSHLRWGFIWGFFIWLNYALAISIDYPNIFLMLPVMIYFLLVSISIKNEGKNYKIKLRLSHILTSVFFVVITLLHGYYNIQNFGGWSKVSGGLLGYKVIQENNLDNGNLEENSRIIEELSRKKNPAKFITENHLVRSSYELLIAFDKGIFIFNPVFLLSIGGMYFALKKWNLEKNILISSVIVNLFFYSSWGDPWGGWAFGPRYLIPSMPLLAIFASYFLTLTKYQIISKLVAFPLIAYSCAVSLLGALTTNAVPPKIEAIYIKSKYGFPFNIDFLLKDHTDVFMFKEYFSHLGLVNYYLILFSAIIVLISIPLFIMPLISALQNRSVQHKKKHGVHYGN